MSFGQFEGDVVTWWLKEPNRSDRTMQLVKPFAYVDPAGRRWSAEAGRQINGASIPAALWNTVGPPYVGDYRRATVLHDVACEDKTEPHEAVHLMFYYAMRCDGVGRAKSTLMYEAVRRYGPKWGPLPMDFSAIDAWGRSDLTASELDRLEAAVGQALKKARDPDDPAELSAEVDRFLSI